MKTCIEWFLSVPGGAPLFWMGAACVLAVWLWRKVTHRSPVHHDGWWVPRDP